MSDMYLFIAPADIMYLTGVMTHDSGEVMILSDDSRTGYVLCDPRTSGLFDASQWHIVDRREEWGDVLARYGLLETDPEYLTQTLRDVIEPHIATLTMAPSPVAMQRMIKTPDERRKLQESQRLNKAVFERIQTALKPGVTEEQIAREIQILQLTLGASGPSFPPIVAFGEHTAIPHHSPTHRVLQEGDVILIDMGLIFEGYCSDMTRCICPILSDISPRPQRMYTLLQDVTQHIITWAKPGMKMCELDAKAREMLGEYSQYFTHSLGHGVGIQIHEAPRVSGSSDDILQEGMVITIEPGLYGLSHDDLSYGLRYEEMVFVDKEKLRVL